MMCHWLLSFFSLHTHHPLSGFFCVFFRVVDAKIPPKEWHTRNDFGVCTKRNETKKKIKYTFYMSNLGKTEWEAKFMQLIFFICHTAKRCEMHFKVQCAWALEMLGYIRHSKLIRKCNRSPQLDSFTRVFSSLRRWVKEILLFSIHIIFTHTHLQM